MTGDKTWCVINWFGDIVLVCLFIDIWDTVLIIGVKRRVYIVSVLSIKGQQG